ncbi:MAG: hypothetical protein WCT08_05320 [Patescibacteria group bacterium]|jgi:hypothetical protein
MNESRLNGLSETDKNFSWESSNPTEGHIPQMLEWEKQYGGTHVTDERGFEISDPSLRDPEFFEKQIAQINLNGLENHGDDQRTVVKELILSLGRLPSPAEVQLELFRQRMFDQIKDDEQNPFYIKEEVEPQRQVIEKRKEDFPAPEHALEAFRDGKVRIEESDGVQRLIIEVPNQKGEMVEHPVMTNEEIEWVRKSADAIARVMKGKNDSKIFIAGLGLGLLNAELVKRGIDPQRQVIAELNTNVIEKVGSKLKQEFGSDLDIRSGTSLEVFQKAIDNGEELDLVSMVNSTEQMMQRECPPEKGDLDIRQGDFKAVLQEAIDKGEQFEAISIDAFPNTAEEVNRDASSKEVLELALKALKPGGMLTFYPDSRYIPKRIWEVLHQAGIPDTSMNYTVAKFKTSDFTQGYHYGELMAVVHIQKPLLTENSNQEKIDGMLDQYYEELDDRVREYVEKHQDQLTNSKSEDFQTAA